MGERDLPGARRRGRPGPAAGGIRGFMEAEKAEEAEEAEALPAPARPSPRPGWARRETASGVAGGGQPPPGLDAPGGPRAVPQRQAVPRPGPRQPQPPPGGAPAARHGPPGSAAPSVSLPSPLPRRPISVVTPATESLARETLDRSGVLEPRETQSTELGRLSMLHNDLEGKKLTLGLGLVLHHLERQAAAAGCSVRGLHDRTCTACADVTLDVSSLVSPVAAGGRAPRAGRVGGWWEI